MHCGNEGFDIYMHCGNEGFDIYIYFITIYYGYEGGSKLTSMLVMLNG